MIESAIVPVTEIETVKPLDREIKEVHELLDKLHNQKQWFRPKNQPYVSG
jgi:hypothetical protein